MKITIEHVLYQLIIILQPEVVMPFQFQLFSTINDAFLSCVISLKIEALNETLYTTNQHLHSTEE